MAVPAGVRHPLSSLHLLLSTKALYISFSFVLSLAIPV
jgi:hypothetical protein